MLDGPAVAPAGAVRVDPGQELNAITQARPAGTTFWLAPGVHNLNPGMYGAVTPKAGNSYIGAPGAILSGVGVNRYAFVGPASNVTIQYLTIRDFVAPGQEAVVNHDQASGWVIEHNTIKLNGGAGIYGGNDNVIRYNCLAENSQYGLQANGKNITVTYNEIARNNTYDYETKQPGCGCSGGTKFWGAGPGTVSFNWVHDNANVGLWWDNNNIGFLIQGNYIADNFGHGIGYETSYNFRIVDNTLKGNAKGVGQQYQARGDNFPIGAIYISESGGDPRLNGGIYGISEITGNVFDNNWSGVVLWENTDRFGNDGSANTSKGYTTLAVDPSGQYLSPLLSNCNAGTILTSPNRQNCRWKTQNVRVTNNTFSFDKATVGCTTSLCGQQAIFSNFGTVPSWSPYLARTTQDAITFQQDNVFANNRYVGPWVFIGYEAIGRTLTLSQWKAAPFAQDSGSTQQ